MLAVLVQMMGCTELRREAAPGEYIVALTADGYLTLMRAADGAVTERHQVADHALGVWPGRYLAHEPGTRRVFALLVRTGHGTAEIAKITIGTTRVERHSLRDARVDFRAIVLASRWRAVLVAGAASTGVGLARVNIDSLDDQATVISALGDFDWRVYDVAVNAAEDTLFVTYHGSRTTGLDAFDVSSLQIHSCERSPPNHGCLSGHGRLATSSVGLITATGSRFVYVYRGATRDSVDLGLNTHLMEIAFDSAGARLIGIAPCGSGGVSVYGMDRAPPTDSLVDADPTPSFRFVPNALPCGDRLAVLQGENAIVATSGEGRLSIIDLRTRQVIRTIQLSSQVLDVLVIEASQLGLTT